MSKWVNHITDNGEAKINLFCFPHAGASSAFFAKWARYFSKNINLRMVQYPMRDNRYLEKMPDTIQELAYNMSVEGKELFDEPFAFLGHCSGAIIAYETAQAIKKNMDKEPDYLVLSSAISPGKTCLSSTKDLSEDEFCKKYDIPMDILNQNRELKEFFMPIIRKDFELCEKYRCTSEPLLSCPILCICGNSDNSIQDLYDVEDWKHYTHSEKFLFKVLDGNHFYFDKEPEQICQFIEKTILSDGAL